MDRVQDPPGFVLAVSRRLPPLGLLASLWNVPIKVVFELERHAIHRQIMLAALDNDVVPCATQVFGAEQNDRALLFDSCPILAQFPEITSEVGRAEDFQQGAEPESSGKSGGRGNAR